MILCRSAPTGPGITGAKGRAYTRENPPPPVFPFIVSDGYLAAMGIPLRAGRDFNEHDTLASKPVALINEALARLLWPGQDPIGQTLLFPEREVVGVVADVRHLALEEPAGNELYLPLHQMDDHFPMDLVIRTATSVRGAGIAGPPGAQAHRARTRTLDERVQDASGHRGPPGLAPALRRHGAWRICRVRARARLSRHLRGYCVHREPAATGVRDPNRPRRVDRRVGRVGDDADASLGGAGGRHRPCRLARRCRALSAVCSTVWSPPIRSPSSGWWPCFLRLPGWPVFSPRALLRG